MKSTSELTRTQIYLTQQQQVRLTQVSRGSAATKSALIREAIDRFLDQQPATRPAEKVQQLQGIAGLWAGHADMADPETYVRAIRQPRRL